MKSQKGLSSKHLVVGLSALAGLCVSHSASAQFSMFSESVVGVNNAGYVDSLDFQYVSDNSVATASKVQQFTGKDGANTTQTMTFNGAATSQSNFGDLHCYTSASVANSYYNASNSPYADTNGNTIDPNGSPSTLATLSFAGFTDTLQFGGILQSGYRARYIFHVDGTNTIIGNNSEDNPNGGTFAGAGLDVQIAGDATESFFAWNTGPYAADWATQDHPVNGITPQQVRVQFSSNAFFNLYNLTDGQNYGATSDFSSTLKLTGIELLDADGNLASGWSVTSASGTKYNAIQGSAVPEPGTLALLFGSSVGGFGVFVRRKLKK